MMYSTRCGSNWSSSIQVLKATHGKTLKQVIVLLNILGGQEIATSSGIYGVSHRGSDTIVEFLY